MKIRVLFSCTKDKIPNQTVENTYVGQSNVMLMSGVREARRHGHTVETFVVSAKYGWLNGNATGFSADYDTRMSTLVDEQRKRAQGLAFIEDFRTIMASPNTDLTIVAVPRGYLNPCLTGVPIVSGSNRVLVLSDYNTYRRMTFAPGPLVSYMPCGNDIAPLFGCPTSRLKGVMLHRYLSSERLLNENPLLFSALLEAHREVKK